MTLFFPEDADLHNSALAMISSLNDGDRPWCDWDAELVQSMADRIVELNQIILTQSIRIAELNRKPVVPIRESSPAKLDDDGSRE